MKSLLQLVRLKQHWLDAKNKTEKQKQTAIARIDAAISARRKAFAAVRYRRSTDKPIKKVGPIRPAGL